MKSFYSGPKSTEVMGTVQNRGRSRERRNGSSSANAYLGPIRSASKPNKSKRGDIPYKKASTFEEQHAVSISSKLPVIPALAKGAVPCHIPDLNPPYIDDNSAATLPTLPVSSHVLFRNSSNLSQ